MLSNRKKVKRKQNVLIFSLSIISIALLAFWLIPAFIYNELEYNFRSNFQQHYINIDKSEVAIDTRVNDPRALNNTELFIQYGDGIERTIETAIKSLEKSNNYNQAQTRLLPLLSAQHQHYHQEKSAAISKRIDLMTIYLQQKHNEQTTTNIMYILSDLTNKLRDMSDINAWLIANDSIPEITSNIALQIQELSDNGHLTEELKKYYSDWNESLIFFHNETLKVAESGSWEKFDVAGFVERTPKTDDLLEMFKRQRDFQDSSRENFQQETAHNNEAIRISSNYYNENKLGYDILSRLLAIASRLFPRVGYIEGKPPAIIPPGVDPQTVGVVL